MADVTNAMYHWLSTDVHDDWLVLCGFFFLCRRGFGRMPILPNLKHRRRSSVEGGHQSQQPELQFVRDAFSWQLLVHVSAWIQPDGTDIVTAPTTFLKPAPQSD